MKDHELWCKWLKIRKRMTDKNLHDRAIHGLLSGNMWDICG